MSENSNNELLIKLQRASIELVVLKMLSVKDMYGYQLIAEISKRTNSLFVYRESFLYKTLNKLLEGGYISEYNILSEKNRMRIYYHLEKNGVKYFNKVSNEFRLYLELMNSCLDYDGEEFSEDEKNRKCN